MRIAYLSTFYPFRGGISQFNAALKQALELQGHEVNAFTFTTQYPKILFPGETQMVSDSDNAEPIDSKRVISSINPLTYHSAAKQIKAWQPDLLIMKYWMSFFAPSLGYISNKIGKQAKTLAILDNVIPHEKRFFDSAFTNYFLKHTQLYVAMSEKVKNDLLSLKPEANVTILPHPLYNHFGNLIDTKEARKKLQINQDKKTLLFFGFIRDYKGLDMLIDSMELLDNSYQLIIAGESYGNYDKYKEQIEKSSRKTDIHQHVRYISDQEVPLFFSAADVCVLPYRSATQSGITGISYHFNLPMIATDVGGLAEIIHHEKTGIISPEASSKSITKSIQSFFSDTSTAKYRNNIMELKKELSWEEMASKIIEFTSIH